MDSFAKKLAKNKYSNSAIILYTEIFNMIDCTNLHKLDSLEKIFFCLNRFIPLAISNFSYKCRKAIIDFLMHAPIINYYTSEGKR